jgi:hypothetical protein
VPQYANVDANNRVDIRNGEGMLLSSLFRISSILLNALHIFQKKWHRLRYFFCGI